MHGVDAGVLADVIGHILAHSHDCVGGADARASWLRWERRNRDRTGLPGWRAPGRPRAPFGAQGDFQQQLRRIVRGGQDDFGLERLHLRGEVGAQVGIGDHVDVHAGAFEDHDTAVADDGVDAARSEAAPGTARARGSPKTLMRATTRHAWPRAASASMRRRLDLSPPPCAG